MAFFDFSFSRLEGNLQRLAQDNAWSYAKDTCGLDVRSLPASVVQEANDFVAGLHETMSPAEGFKVFSVAEEAALRVAVVAAHAVTTKQANVDDLVLACANVLSSGARDIRPGCTGIVNDLLYGAASESVEDEKQTATATYGQAMEFHVTTDQIPAPPSPSFVHTSKAAQPRHAQPGTSDHITVAQSHRRLARLIGSEPQSGVTSAVPPGSRSLRRDAIIVSTASFCAAFAVAIADEFGRFSWAAVTVIVDIPPVFWSFVTQAVGASVLLPLLVTGAASCFKGKGGTRFRWGLLLGLSLLTLVAALARLAAPPH